MLQKSWFLYEKKEIDEIIFLGLPIKNKNCNKQEKLFVSNTFLFQFVTA